MTKIIKWQLLLSALLLSVLFGKQAQGATYTAASCSESDVANAVAQATNGDTVIIPACSSTTPGGTNTWTTSLTITVGITLQGQGIGNTVLIDNVSKGNSSCGAASPMLTMSPGTNNFRITGFTLQGDAPDTYVCQPGHIVLTGTGSASRVDHISFSNQQTVGIRTSGCIYGVIDHNTFQGTFKQGVMVWHDGCGGDSYGDYNWNAATQLGTANFIFIETNTFTDPSAVGAGAMDNFGGSRVVFRYNTASFIVGHGTESTGRVRGMRAFEIYNNTFTAIEASQFAAFYVRSGTGVIHDNQFNDSGSFTYGATINVINDRDSDAFSPWGTPAGSGHPGACDGTGPYDGNAGTVYASGTYNGTSGVSNVMTDSTKSFTTNQWVGSYAIRNVTEGWGAIIASNTSNTITNASSAYGQSRNWNSGDSYQVLSAYPCTDQVGRGVGVLLSGATPTPTSSVSEALEPVYQWNNTHNGVSGSVTISSQSMRIVANRDYYDNTPMPGYTPYVYPHPLVSGTPPPPPPTGPAAPSGLAAVVHSN
jgi:hypothetical protein